MSEKKDMRFHDLNLDIIKGRANGRVLWQPRIGCWFSDRKFTGEPYEAPYAGLSNADVYRKIGCSDRIYHFNEAMKQYYLDDTIKHSRSDIDDLRWKDVIETPVGSIFSVNRRNLSNYGVFPEKWFVETEEDLKVLIYIQERISYRFDKETYDRLFAEVGDLGLPSSFVPRVNVQRLFVESMGVEGTIYALSDFPDTAEEYFRACGRSDDRYMDAVIEGGYEWINYGDNVHGGVLSPELFIKYVLHEYQRRNEYLHAHGIFTFAHWDGDCKSLFPYAKETGLDGIEAVTPLPQGDVTLAEAREAMGGMYMIDGIAAVLFDEMYPLEDLMGQVRECIELFPDRLIMGISDELCSTGTLERVKRVADYVNEYNEKL